MVAICVLFFLVTSSLRVLSSVTKQQEQQYFTSHPSIRKQNTLVQAEDFIYKRENGQWDSAPIVVEEYKLLFFAVPKVACTTFKQLFRRINGAEDWMSQDTDRILPHNPDENGLKYLWNYTIEEASRMMTSPEYTRAIFVREPKARFLSAFLDKGLGNFHSFMRTHCCPDTGECVERSSTTEGFLEVIQSCHDPHWNAQTWRMEAKYWPFINFVGHFENLAVDGPRLLREVGAWEKYGQSGWGKNGTSSMFDSMVVSAQSHATQAATKVWTWLTPSLERRIEEYYIDDYEHRLFNFPMTNLTRDFWIRGSDIVYSRVQWDGAPVVITKYKLIFFTVPRIGDTIWKKAFRRMENFTDWSIEGGPDLIPWNPNKNGLKYLYDFEPDIAEKMMKDPTWTKAIFIRNPKDRLLDMYTYLIQHPEQVRNACCKESPGCEGSLRYLSGFIDLVGRCESALWKPQSQRMESKYWPYVNFVGRMESIEEDSKRLLTKIGAWNAIGATGWGKHGENAIFSAMGDSLEFVRKALDSYSPAVDGMLDQVYKEDLDNPLFNFGKKLSLYDY
eukprot:Nitzschia sp. Nitz4//scaffold39_size137210//59230//60906//NITZ4_003199-RA/size137210-processed-gene-0.63-mRNA-1//-1//CDS//3329550383//3623//frame0